MDEVVFVRRPKDLTSIYSWNQIRAELVNTPVFPDPNLIPQAILTVALSDFSAFKSFDGFLWNGR
jgi:hypothetical protein